jgi:tetratricopeptide (TPR) repeat protein
MAAAGSPAWVGRLLRVGLPTVVLLGLASLAPDETMLARFAAQGAAVVVPLGIEVARTRWQRAQERERALRGLRGRLDPLAATVPEGLRDGLDDPAYRVTPYWGRAAAQERLDAVRALPAPAVALVIGPAWTGKTRLLGEWALTLPPEVVAGWLRPGTIDAVLAEADALDARLVLLYAGDAAHAGEAIAAVAGSGAAVTLVTECRDSSQIADVAAGISAAAGRLVREATVISVENPGGDSDLEHRYGEMVLAYAKAAGTSSAHPAPPKPPRAWRGAPIGLVSAFAMLHAQGGRASVASAPLDSFAGYWTTLSRPWLRDRPAARFGLPPLSDPQLETALVVHLLTTGHQAESVLAGLPLLADQLNHHQLSELAKWAAETSPAGQTRPPVLAAVAATQAWKGSQRAELAVAAATVSPGLAALIRSVVVVEQILGQRPLLTEILVAANAKALRAALTALVGETPSRPIDLLLAERVTAAPLTFDDVESLLSIPSVGRLPNTDVALRERQLALLPAETATEQRAELANNLAIMLSELGRAGEALGPAQEAVTLLRRLADPDTGIPDRYTPDLAGSLGNLAARLSEVGRLGEALGPAQEAVTLLRRLADPDTGIPDRYTPDLAVSLNNLAAMLSELGRAGEALGPAQEAVALLRRLADPDTGIPDRYTPDLAGSLNNLAIRLSEVGRPGEALGPAQEAVTLRRRMADPDTGIPDRYTPDLAVSLNNLAARLSEVGRPGEALGPAQEAVTLYRRLADPDTGIPDRYTPDLAVSLNNLAAMLSEVGRPGEALGPAQEAVTLRRRLADPDTGIPDRYTPDLAVSLNNLAAMLSEVGRAGEALGPAQEAVALLRRLADPDTGIPDRYTPDLAVSLNNLAAMLSEVGRPGEALGPAQEAVALRRRLADPDTGNPDRYTPDLAVSLNTLAGRLSELGRPGEALAPAREAVALYRRLAHPDTGNPGLYGSKLARAERRLQEAMQAAAERHE